jgi:hypothetical protein
MSQIVPQLKPPRTHLAELDKLKWTAGFAFRPYEQYLGIRTNRPDLLEPLKKLLLPGWSTEPIAEVDYLFSVYAETGADGSTTYAIYGDSSEILRTARASDIATAIDAWLHIVVAHFASHRLFVHAGAVVWKDRAILIPGASMSGKSTLVAALVDQGARYWSDDFAVLDGEARVFSYPVPLQLRTTQQVISAPDLGWKPDLGGVRVGLIAILPYKSGAQLRLRKISPAKATMELIQNTVTAVRDFERWMRLLPDLTSQCVCLKGTRNEAAPAAERLLERIESIRF